MYTYHNEVQQVQHAPTMLEIEVGLLALSFFGPMIAVIFLASLPAAKILLVSIKATVLFIALVVKSVLCSSLALVILSVSLARSADGEALLHILYTGKGVFSPTETLLEGVTFVRVSSAFILSVPTHILTNGFHITE